MSSRPLTDLTVAILGLGQIGSSLGAALIQRRLVRRVVGTSRKPEVRRKAVEIRSVHEATDDPVAAAAAADIVIPATPVRHLLRSIPGIVKAMKPGTLFLDVGSTKEEILRAALHAKPHHVNVVGGHPMAGTEKAGIDACDPDLFTNHPFILIPGRILKKEAMNWAAALAQGVGSHLVIMHRGADHDRGVATISHLPYLIAYTLMHTAEEVSRRHPGPMWKRNLPIPWVLSLAGPSFRGATRVARSDVDMVLDFLLTNRREIPAIAAVFARRLLHAAALVRKGNEKQLRKLLEEGRDVRGKMD